MARIVPYEWRDVGIHSAGGGTGWVGRKAEFYYDTVQTCAWSDIISTMLTGGRGSEHAAGSSGGRRVIQLRTGDPVAQVNGDSSIGRDGCIGFSVDANVGIEREDAKQQSSAFQTSLQTWSD